MEMGFRRGCERLLVEVACVCLAFRNETKRVADADMGNVLGWS